MRIKFLHLLLVVLIGFFFFVLSLFFLTQQDGDVIFSTTPKSFAQGHLRISQTSQAKEQAISQTTLIRRKTSYPSQPLIDESAKILHDYEVKIEANYLWGTYKPHLIHAVTQRSKNPLTFGFMYMAAEAGSRLIHSYKSIKGLPSYFTEYIYHDGKSFSESILVEKNSGLRLHNYFYKEKMDSKRQRWHSITVKDDKKVELRSYKASLIYYFMIEEFEEVQDTRYLEFINDEGMIRIRKPNEEPTGYFKIVVYDKNGKAVGFSKLDKDVFVDSTTKKGDTWKVQNILEQKMGYDMNLRLKIVPNNYDSRGQTAANLTAVQLMLDPSGPFTVHIIYDTINDPNDEANDKNYVDEIIKRSQGNFNSDYNKIFSKKVDTYSHQCALSALSNLISGIGYYYGNIVVKGQSSLEPKLPLYTGTPSKTEFPRGFLWDEGFHGLVYCKWNLEICLDVLKHWMGTQLDNGWIPREQLRGSESVSNGHPNYIAQIKDEANPPTLMFLVNALIESKERGQLPDGALKTLNKLCPNLKKWFDWFYSSQASEGKEGLFTWRSNQADLGLVMGSGLDDYPRGLYGGVRRPLGHLDLQVWMIFMAENMEKVANFAGRNDDAEAIKDIRTKIKDSLQEYFDPEEKIYKDLVEDNNGNKRFSPHFGYVNLFPLFFGYLKNDSPELDVLLDYMRNPMKLWSPFGLLSLSRDDSLYMKTRDSYWGGPVWINMNYLTLRGLKKYYYNNVKARKIYEELRANVIRTVREQKEQHGYFYEQYNQDYGYGQKNFPFTGWTTTILLIIYEQY